MKPPVLSAQAEGVQYIARCLLSEAGSPTSGSAVLLIEKINKLIKEVAPGVISGKEAKWVTN